MLDTVPGIRPGRSLEYDVDRIAGRLNLPLLNGMQDDLCPGVMNTEHPLIQFFPAGMEIARNFMKDDLHSLEVQPAPVSSA